MVDCSRSLHVLRVLRTHGLPTESLHEVARTTTIARLMYASSAWWGYTTADDRSRLQRFVQKAKRMGFLPPQQPDVDLLASNADDRLLQAIVWNANHVLRGLFPPVARRRYDLRPRPHDFELPPKDEQNFVPRVLYKRVPRANSRTN